MAEQRKPLTPTRILRPGEHLPTETLNPANWGPPPPRRDLPPSVEPQPPAAGPVEVRHHVTVELVPEREPEPRSWSFAWLRRHLRPWQSLIAAALAVTPSPAYGHSLTSAWAAVLDDARTDGLGTAYTLAAVALTAAVLLDVRTGRWWARTLLVVTLIGGTGALGWYDPVTWLTGVRP